MTTVEPRELDELAAAAERTDGFPSLGESDRRDVGSPSAGSLDVVAEREGRLAAVLHVSASDSTAHPHRAGGMVMAPDAREPGLATAILERAIAEIGDEALIVWFPGSPEHATKAAAAAGLVHQRDLHRMEVALPLAEEPSWPPGVAVRSFRVGEDEEAWLRVNDRAFAGHPEQSGWSIATLRRRMEEPWFEPEGFRLAFADGSRPDDGALAGFCWTKRHDPEVGEIFVIGVDPDHQGLGLGRSLVVAGLDSLAGRGTTTGMLYVDAANVAAVGLYESLGFRVVRTDAAYARGTP